MPRHNTRREVERLRPLGGGSAARRDEWRGASFLVRTVPGANAGKPYRCPGCAQIIPVGVPHLVVWPDADDDAADRRHWHRACWDARGRRGPA
jgi:hypothetical protein